MYYWKSFKHLCYKNLKQNLVACMVHGCDLNISPYICIIR